MPRNVTKVSISLPNGLFDLLTRKAKREDRSRSTVVKRLIEDGIAYRAEHRLIDAGVGYQTGGDDETPA